MVFSVSTYSFAKLMWSGKMTQKDCIAKAKEIGFDAIEIESLRHDDSISDEEYALELKKEAERVGIKISNFTFGADLLNGCDGDTKKEVERIKHMIDLAEILGVDSVRHDCTAGYPKDKRGYTGFDDVLDILADACREITEYAETKGIKTMIENHGCFSQDSDRVEKLVNRVAHKNFGLLVDMGNFLCADENPATAVGRVAPYAFYAHAKDFHVKSPMGQNPGKGFFQSRNGTLLRGAIIGHGDVPVKHCLSALKLAGFDGTLAIEFEGMEDPIEGITIGLENLKRYVSELG